MLLGIFKGADKALTAVALLAEGTWISGSKGNPSFKLFLMSILTQPKVPKSDSNGSKNHTTLEVMPGLRNFTWNSVSGKRTITLLTVL